MNFEIWEPVYERILADMGYDRTADERARDVLAELLDVDVSAEEAVDSGSSADSGSGPLETLEHAVSGSQVAIVAPGPPLEDQLDRLADADAVLAASTAVDRLAARGIEVDCLVTDLDGNPGVAAALTAEGVPVAVHAHGDNVPALREHVPEMARDAVIPTTQAEPAGPVRNFGGFTDGDRAVFLADHLGAARLVFVGWDLADPSVDPEKRRKLRWAARLLRWLELRREERFALLDGFRDDLDVDGFPR